LGVAGLFARVGANVLGIETPDEFPAGSDRELEPGEFPRVLHAHLEFVGVKRDDAAVSRPAARSQFVQRAIGEHVLEPSVALSRSSEPTSITPWR
jgi:hypothetical protein